MFISLMLFSSLLSYNYNAKDTQMDQDHHRRKQEPTGQFK